MIRLLLRTDMQAYSKWTMCWECRKARPLATSSAMRTPRFSQNLQLD